MTAGSRLGTSPGASSKGRSLIAVIMDAVAREAGVLGERDVLAQAERQQRFFRYLDALSVRVDLRAGARCGSDRRADRGALAAARDRADDRPEQCAASDIR